MNSFYMSKVYLHAWMPQKPLDQELADRKNALEVQLRDEGYQLEYSGDYVYGVIVSVVFKDEAQAAIYKLTYM